MDKATVKAALKQFRTQYAASFFLSANNDLTQVFEGVILRVAETYRDALKMDSQEFGINPNSVHNAAVRTMLKLTQAEVKCTKNPCRRCDGTGRMPYPHVKGGVCLKCGGSGQHASAQA